MSVSGPAYIAMKTKDGDLWIPTGHNEILPDVFPYYTPPAQGQPQVDEPDAAGPPVPTDTNGYYAPVWTISAEVKREYGGINSSGGPQVSGRSDQSDFFVEMPSNTASPRLYEHCCSGKQLAWVHLAVVQWDAGNPRPFLHIRMKDVNITSYEFNGVRYMQDDFVGVQASGARAFGMQSNSAAYDLGHTDEFTLLYTSISFDYQWGGQRGWDTSTDRAWTA